MQHIECTIEMKALIKNAKNQLIDAILSVSDRAKINRAINSQESAEMLLSDIITITNEYYRLNVEFNENFNQESTQILNDSKSCKANFDITLF